MMYSEFLEMSGTTENYISHAEYTNEIEPIYTDCELSKNDFLKLLNDAFEKIVYPAVEKAVHNLPMQEKSLLIAGSKRIKKQVGEIDQAARKVAYEYMKLYSQL